MHINKLFHNTILILSILFILINCQNPINIPFHLNKKTSIPLIKTNKTATDCKLFFSKNLINNGDLVADNEWIYFLEKCQSLLKMKKDGTDYIELDNGSFLSRIFLYSDRVYYFERTDFISIKQDGSDRREIAFRYHDQAMIVISNLISIRDWFYFCACPAYTENQHIRNLFKMKPDGSQMTLIRDGEVDNLNIAGNDLLFSDMSKNGIIIKWNLDDFSETNLTSEPAKQILVDEKAIYYLDKEDILYSLDFSGDNKYQICRDPISIYNISEDWIYFSNKKDHNYLYRIRKDGVNQTRINQDVSLQIYVNGDTVYYLNESKDNQFFLYREDGTEHHWIGEKPTCTHPPDNTSGINITFEDSDRYQDYNRISSGRINILDDWLYVCLPVDEAYDLVRMKFDGAKVQMIKNYTYLSSLSLYNKDILFRLDSDRSSAYVGELWKIPSIGEKSQSVIDYPITDYTIQGDWIYFSDSDRYKKLFIRNLKTKEQYCLCNDVASDISVVNGWVYYVNRSDSNNLYKIRTDRKNRINLTSSPVSMAMVHGEWIYYLNEQDVLCRIDLNGKNFNQISTAKISSFNMNDQWIYFINEEDERLYRTSFDRWEPIEVSTKYIVSIGVFKENVFYIASDDNLYCVFTLLPNGDEKKLYPEPKRNLHLR